MGWVGIDGLPVFLFTSSGRSSVVMYLLFHATHVSVMTDTTHIHTHVPPYISPCTHCSACNSIHLLNAGP